MVERNLNPDELAQACDLFSHDLKKLEIEVEDVISNEKAKDEIKKKEKLLHDVNQLKISKKRIHQDLDSVIEQEEHKLNTLKNIEESDILGKASHISIKKSELVDLQQRKKDLEVFKDFLKEAGSEIQNTIKSVLQVKPDFDRALTKLDEAMSLLLQKEDRGEQYQKLENQRDLIKQKWDNFIQVRDAKVLDIVSKSEDRIEKAKFQAAAQRVESYSKRTRQIDLCFLIDGTGSMQHYINLAKDKVNEIINNIKTIYSGTTFRISAVIYTDFDMGEESFQVQDFVENPLIIKDFLESYEIKDGAGGDIPEDMNGGFQKVLNSLIWKSYTRILIHIADAPCHGSRFHSRPDDFPNPETDVPWEEIFKQVRSLGIDYYFLKIKNSTDQMISEFRKIWDSLEQYARSGDRFSTFMECPIKTDAKEFIQKISKLILESIQMSYFSIQTKNFFDQCFKKTTIVNNLPVIKEELKPIPLDWNAPDQTWITKKGTLYSHDILTMKRLLLDNFSTIRTKCKILIQEKAFAFGSFNAAHAGKLKDTGTRIVAKKALTPRHDNDYLYKDLEKQYVAICVANSFNKKINKLEGNYSWARICFIFPFLFECENEMYMLEGFIEGEYTKYFNNLDYLNQEKETRHLTAFTHYSYAATKGEYLVTDLQGVGFLLTDPAIHSKHREYDFSGDFGEEGIINFFSKHECNEICKLLNLKKPNIPLGQIPKWTEKVYPHIGDGEKVKCHMRFCNKQLEEDDGNTCKECLKLINSKSVASCEECGIQFKCFYRKNILLGHPILCPTCEREDQGEEDMDM